MVRISGFMYKEAAGRVCRELQKIMPQSASDTDRDEAFAIDKKQNFLVLCSRPVPATALSTPYVCDIR
jgi:hypothetical protein